MTINKTTNYHKLTKNQNHYNNVTGTRQIDCFVKFNSKKAMEDQKYNLSKFMSCIICTVNVVW